MLDAGADKPLAFLNDAHEENPALGLRGLRALRASEDILREQLTALAEADAVTEGRSLGDGSDGGNRRGDHLLHRSRPRVRAADRGRHGRDPGERLLADRVLAHADFASIGTNDLTQYTMAADRMLGSVAGFQDPWHPAVLRLVREVGDAGARLGKPVGICGEAALIRSSPSCWSASAPRVSRWLPQHWPMYDTRSPNAPRPRRGASPRPPWPPTMLPPPEPPWQCSPRNSPLHKKETTS